MSIKALKPARKLHSLVFGGPSCHVFARLYRTLLPVRCARFRSRALRPRLSTGLPLSNIYLKGSNKTSLAYNQARQIRHVSIIFGGLAVMSLLACTGHCFQYAAQDLDPWLCVSVFQRVCSYRNRILIDYIIVKDRVFSRFILVRSVCNIETFYRLHPAD
jgi:hypothetical protein